KRSDRVVTIGLQHQSSGELADAKQWIKDGLVGKITHIETWMPEHAARQGAVGAPNPFGLHARQREVGCLPERASEATVRREQVYQLAPVLGILRRERDGEHGSPDRLEHARARPAGAHRGLYVGRGLL